LKPIALDAMGGDHAPQATVEGAVRAARSLNVPVLLVGDQAQLRTELDRHAPVPSGIEIVHAGDAIGMDESPGAALLRRRDASIIVAANLVKDGRASGVASAGNSGAVMGAAVLRLGMLPGVDRPAIAMILPNRHGSTVMLDGGATVDSRPEHLRDFAIMGSAYAHCLHHIERPRVGLLSIGEEPSKGSALSKGAFALLEKTPINFVGNVEGKEIALGAVDVVVCDGFVGNVVLKTIEGYSELFVGMMREQLTTSWRHRLGAWLLRKGLRSIADGLNYASHGGALLVGVNGVCVIGHGRSSPPAIESAIRVAKELANQDIVAEMAASFRQLTASPLGAAAGQDTN